jgi:ABC-type nickel/cobalt efflux system permease component RcnA
VNRFNTGSRAIRLALIGFGWVLICVGGSSLSFAHPMGNFSVNHYAKITVQQDSIEIHYLIDAAEIPTFQEMQQGGFTADPQEAATRKYLNRKAEVFKKNLVLMVSRKPLQFQIKSTEVIFPPGAGGLPTMKMSFVYAATLSAGSPGVASPQTGSIYYRDDNFPSRIGWKEVVAVAGPGVTFLDSTAPPLDRSSELSNYPTDLLNSPPHDLEASISFELPVSASDQGTRGDRAAAELPIQPHFFSVSGNGAIEKSGASSALPPQAVLRADLPRRVITSVNNSVTPPTPVPSLKPIELRPNQQGTPKSRFTELMTAKPFSGWFLIMAAGIAAGLGALHALEPGHGKTIVAAYLVGSRGTARHAVLLGIVVTAAHTAGVYLLGVLTLYASQYIVPERLYPWLGAISGVTVAGLGIFILLRNLTGEASEHSHADGKNHSHWVLSMLKPSVARNLDGLSTSSANKHVSLRELVTLGVTGGIVPCPAALVVLLSAFSLHRIGFGLFLITSFSFGLALVLVIVGLTMVYTKQFMSRFKTSNPLLRYLPTLSSSFMVVLGIGIATSAFTSSPVTHNLISRSKLVPFVTVILLGLFLGMRHSTDPDHVVAVSTIVSRHRSIKHSTMIGMLWGLGHSLTIFLVGAVIIVFGVVIPPRLGLAMEFSVALMLILLGVLNLTGVLRWITERFTPSQTGKETQEGASSNTSLSLPAVEAATGTSARRQTFAESFLEKTVGKLGFYQTLRPFVIGLVHGLAGSAAVALLVLSTIKSPAWATAYLLVFGAGTMVGMMLMTTAIAMPLAYTGKKFVGANRLMTLTSGVFSMAFGLFLVYHIGLVDGLFRAQPHWIPQ